MIAANGQSESQKPLCQLIGTDGNVFAIINTVSCTLKKAGCPQQAAEFMTRAFACRRYDEVLVLCGEYVDVV